MNSRESADRPELRAHTAEDNDELRDFFVLHRSDYNNATTLSLHEETVLNFRQLTQEGSWAVLTMCLPDADSEGFHGFSYVRTLIRNECGRFVCQYLGGDDAVEFELTPHAATISDEMPLGLTDDAYPVVQKGGYLHGSLVSFDDGFENPDWRFGPVIDALHSSDIAVPDNASMLYLN